MKISVSSIFICAVLSAGLPCSAQQSSSSTPTPPSAATAPTAAPTSATAPAASSDQGPSADLLKKAKSVGMKPEIRGGKTVFCWEDSSIGSRFPTKKCTDETGVDAMIAQREAAKATMRQTMTGTSAH